MNDNKIILDVSKILSKEIGESQIEKVSKKIDAIDEFKLTRPVKATVSLTNLGEIILTNFTLETEIELLCSRCAKDFMFPIKLNYQQNYKIEPGDDEFPVLRDQTIDIWPSIRQEILLNIPIKPLCKENCKSIIQKL